MVLQRRRKNPRLPGYDYRTPGLYHVVTGTKGNICRFGAVYENIMIPNDIGQMVDEIWNSIPDKFPAVSLDASVVMPNHFHGIVFIEPQPDDALGISLGKIMQWFKTITTVRYSQGVRERGWHPYDKRFWHRNYYEHIVRDERDLERIRDYIAGNSANWDSDRHFPIPE